MAKLRAVVLAAGRGVRMGGSVPKTIISLGDDQPLLYYILRGLKRSEITDVQIITGFKPEAITEFVQGNSEGLEISFVRNTRYASWGNFHSVRLAIDQSPGFDLLVVNSDVVVHPDVYRRVTESEGDLVLAVDKRYRLDSEDMRVELKVRSVRNIGKQLPRGRSHGEFAGVSLVRPGAAGTFTDIATDWEWRRTTDRYYEDVFAEMLPDVDARAVIIESTDYAEVDTPDDVERARAVIDRHRDTWG